MSEGAGDGSSPATGVIPGALTALLREVAAAPERREEEPVSLLPGTVIGRFEIVRELGRGGFGVVYEARDRDLGRQVALKLVRPGRIMEEDGRVSREAEAIARLAHPNLITLFEVGRCEHGPFLVFELLRGKTLDLRIEEGPLPVQEAVHIATEIARGLSHAHAEGVIHRDLKPANVFVTNRGQVKILDFGMAHAFGRRRLSGGTPAYMAPEQWEDSPEDERTDVFALGVMLYRMLSGEYPFPEREGRWAAEPVMPRKLDVPGAPELADVVERMLDRTPKERPRDGAAALAALTPIEDRLRAKPADGSPPVHAKRRKATFGDLLAELRRRHVFRVMVGYGIFAFAVLQVTEPIMHGAHLPDWVLTVVLVSLVLGFPVAVVLAWVFDLTSQGVKRTVSDPREPLSGRARFLLPFAVSVAVLAVATAGAGAWHAWRRLGDRGYASPWQVSADIDGRIPVAVADFTNQTGDPALDGLSGLLITSLEQSKKLRVMTRGRMGDHLRAMGKGDVERIDEPIAREVGRRSGVRALLVAGIRKLDDVYVVEMRAVDPQRDEYLFTVREQTTGKKELLGLIDRLSERTREELREAPADVAGSRVLVANATTMNLEAYEHYFRGVRLAEQDRIPEAVAEFRKAVAADPRFALAHYRIAYAGEFARLDPEERRAAIEAAMRESGRLSPKDRLLVQALKERMDDRTDEADRLYQQAVQDWPQEKEVLYMAGDLHFHKGRIETAIPYFERALQLDPNWEPALSHLSMGLANLSRDAENLELTRRWVERAPGPAAYRQLAQAQAGSGRPMEALVSARRAYQLEPGTLSRDYLAAFLLQNGAFGEAEALLRPVVSAGGPFVDADPATMLHDALMLQGRRKEALDALEPIRTSFPLAYRRHRYRNHLCEGHLGDARAELDAIAPGWEGNRAEAEQARSSVARFALLASILAPGTPLADALARTLPKDSATDGLDQGLTAWRAGRLEEAATRLRPFAQRKGPRQALALYALGEVEDALGHRSEALASMDGYQTHPDAVFTGFACLAWPRSILVAARSLDALGRREEARARVVALLDAWKGADPDLPLLADARALEARLAPTSR